MKEEFIHKWISQLKKGTLSFLILSILKDQNEYYGYDLMNEIKKRTAIDIAEGTLYPLMNRLKDEDLVVSKWVEQQSGIPRKYYTITVSGLATVKEMAEYWNNLHQTINSI